MYDSNKIENIFNEQFITNIQTINDEFKKQQQISNPIEIPNSNNSINIEPTTQQEIISLITNFKSKTSLDNNLINMKILKLSTDYKSLPLTHIVN